MTDNTFLALQNEQCHDFLANTYLPIGTPKDVADKIFSLASYKLPGVCIQRSTETTYRRLCQLSRFSWGRWIIMNVLEVG